MECGLGMTQTLTQVLGTGVLTGDIRSWKISELNNTGKRSLWIPDRGRDPLNGLHLVCPHMFQGRLQQVGWQRATAGNLLDNRIWMDVGVSRQRIQMITIAMVQFPAHKACGGAGHRHLLPARSDDQEAEGTKGIERFNNPPTGTSSGSCSACCSFRRHLCSASALWLTPTKVSARLASLTEARRWGREEACRRRNVGMNRQMDGFGI